MLLPMTCCDSTPPSQWTVGLVQADTHWADPEANRENLGRLLRESPGCALYVLPETCTTGFLGESIQDLERRHQDDLAWLRGESAARRAAIACSLVAPGERGPVNRFVLMQPDGTMVHYDKRHLFAHGGEHRRYRPGNRRVRTRLWGRGVDLQICYDLRFPVWCRNDAGFDLQLFVANWPSPRIEHWLCLLRARAIENQCFVVGVNRCGRDGRGLDYPGRSVVYGPLGECLAGPLDDSEQVGRGRLDFAMLEAVRRSYPFLADRDRYEIIVDE
ncbi:MAG: amidohydrolase [Wenzhouxiangellaceae bacterium]